MLAEPYCPQSDGANARAENAKDRGRTQQSRLVEETRAKLAGKALEMGESLMAQLEGATALAEDAYAIPLLEAANLGDRLALCA